MGEICIKPKVGQRTAFPPNKRQTIPTRSAYFLFYPINALLWVCIIKYMSRHCPKHCKTTNRQTKQIFKRLIQHQLYHSNLLDTTSSLAQTRTTKITAAWFTYWCYHITFLRVDYFQDLLINIKEESQHVLGCSFAQIALKNLIAKAQFIQKKLYLQNDSEQPLINSGKHTM